MNQGIWQTDEHDSLIKAIQLHGNNWKKLSKCIKTRSPSQIRTHIQKYVSKICKSKKLKIKNYNLDEFLKKIEKLYSVESEIYLILKTFNNYIPVKITSDNDNSDSLAIVSNESLIILSNLSVNNIEFNSNKQKIIENKLESQSFTIIQSSFNLNDKLIANVNELEKAIYCCDKIKDILS